MRYTGPRGKAFSGDRAKAQSLQRAADLLVGQVVQQLKAPPFNGAGHLVQRKRLMDGSWLHVMVNMIGMRPIVRTWIESPVGVVKLLEETTTEILLYDSGYLNVDNLSQTLDYGVRLDDELADWLGYIGCHSIGDAYINPRAHLSLPQLYALRDDFTTELVPEPESFWPVDGIGEDCSNAKAAAIKSTNPMEKASGKMRLYQQAKLGVKLLDAECPFADRVVAADNRGIIRDETGAYYVVDIDAQQAIPEATFTPLIVDPELLPPLRTDEKLFDYLRAETDALAAAVSDESSAYTATILQNDITWSYPNYGTNSARPMAGGFKFSWSTNKAAIVLHFAVRVAGSDALFFYKRADIQTEVYEITFAREMVVPDGETEPVMRFVPRIELLESKQWLYSHGWHWWFPIVGETSTQMWGIPDGPSVGTEELIFPVASDIPIYGYYTAENRVENDTLSLLRVSRTVSSVGPEIETGLFGEKVYGLYNGRARLDSYTYDENTKTDFSLEFCANQINGSSRGVYRANTVTGSLGGQWTPEVSMDTPYRPPTGLFMMQYAATGEYQTVNWSGTSATVSSNTVPSFQDVGYCPYGGGPGYDPEVAPPAGFATYRNVSYYQVSGTFTVVRSESLGNRDTAIPRFAIPTTDAESIVVFTRISSRVTEDKYKYIYDKDTWGARDDDVGYYAPADPGEYPCGGTYPDLSNPVSVGSSDNWGPIYDNRRTVIHQGRTEFVSVQDRASVLGKDGWDQPITFECVASTRDANIQTTNGKPCLIYSPLSYLTDYRLINDETWGFGIKITQGVFGAKRMATRVTEFADYGLFVPSRREWLRQTGVAGGWPAELADDDNTIPIGWA